MKLLNTCGVRRAISRGAAFAVAAAAVLAPLSSGAGAGKVSLAAGTVIAAHLQDELSSNNSAKGDTFTASVQSSDTKGDMGSTALPVGTKLWGVVREVKAKHDKDPGTLDLIFKKAILPNGKSYAISGAVIGLDNKSVVRTSDGRLVATKAHRTSRLTYVGYGAGAGLLVGLVTGKHRPVQDTAIGAGLGYLYGALEKGKSGPRDVKLKSGTKMGIRLDAALNYYR